MKIKETVKLLLGKLFNSQLWERLTNDDEYQNELESIKYGEKSLLTTGGADPKYQPMYQIIDMGDRFLFADVDDGNYITDFENIPEDIFKAKLNFVLSKKDISSVDIGVDYESDESDKDKKLIEYAEIRLRWKVRVKDKRGWKTNRRFLSLALTDEIEEEKLRAFFADAGRLRIMPDEEFDRLNGHILTSKEVSVRGKLKKVIVAIPIASVLCIFCMLLPYRDLRNVFIVIGAILPFVLFGLMVIFPHYLLVRRGEDSRWDETKWERTIDTEPAFIITSGAQFILLCVCEFRLFPLADDGFGQWVALAAVPSVVVAGVMLLITLSQTNGWKDRLYTALLCLLFAVQSCFGAVYLLNGALDANPPAVHSAQIEKKWTDRGYKGGEYYCVRTVRKDGTKEEFDILEAEYERVEKGDFLTIEEYAGALGISYKKAVIPGKEGNQ